MRASSFLFLYIADRAANRIRRVASHGIINTPAGTGVAGWSGEQGPAGAGQFNEPQGIALAPDGSLYVADSQNHRIRRIASALPGFVGLGDISVASKDGRELYIFNDRGKHLRTVDALTARVRYQFGYDGAGRLAAVTDAEGGARPGSDQGNPLESC